MAAVLSGTALAGCGTPAQPNKPDDDVGTKFDLPDAPEGAVIEADGNKALAAGGYRLDFVKTGDAYGINVVDASASTAAVGFQNETPAILNVRGPATTLLGSFDESSFSAGYETLAERDGKGQ